MCLSGLTVYLFVFLSVRLSVSQVLDSCNQLTSCACQSSNGTIDLAPLAATGTAKWTDKGDGSGTWFYSWNPCHDFSEGTKTSQNCVNVAACQSDNTGANYYSLGNQSSAQFVTDANGLSLQYTATTDIKRTAVVKLVCDETVEAAFTVEGEEAGNPGKYAMTLTSKYCCASGGGGPGITLSISIGSVLVIILFGVVFVYIVFGSIFSSFVRKNSGREMIPNYNAWVSILGLISTGFQFTFTCGRRSGYGKV